MLTSRIQLRDPEWAFTKTLPEFLVQFFNVGMELITGKHNCAVKGLLGSCPTAPLPEHLLASKTFKPIMDNIDAAQRSFLPDASVCVCWLTWPHFDNRGYLVSKGVHVPEEPGKEETPATAPGSSSTAVSKTSDSMETLKSDAMEEAVRLLGQRCALVSPTRSEAGTDLVSLVEAQDLARLGGRCLAFFDAKVADAGRLYHGHSPFQRVPLLVADLFEEFLKAYVGIAKPGRDFLVVMTGRCRSNEARICPLLICTSFMLHIHEGCQKCRSLL